MCAIWSGSYRSGTVGRYVGSCAILAEKVLWAGFLDRGALLPGMVAPDHGSRSLSKRLFGRVRARIGMVRVCRAPGILLLFSEVTLLFYVLTPQLLGREALSVPLAGKACGRFGISNRD
jgi:hypothetical protein